MLYGLIHIPPSRWLLGLPIVHLAPDVPYLHSSIMDGQDVLEVVSLRSATA